MSGAGGAALRSFLCGFSAALFYNRAEGPADLNFLFFVIVSLGGFVNLWLANNRERVIMLLGLTVAYAKRENPMLIAKSINKASATAATGKVQ